jgi:hypothetical protein
MLFAPVPLEMDCVSENASDALNPLPSIRRQQCVRV